MTEFSVEESPRDRLWKNIDRDAAVLIDRGNISLSQPFLNAIADQRVESTALALPALANEGENLDEADLHSEQALEQPQATTESEAFIGEGILLRALGDSMPTRNNRSLLKLAEALDQQEHGRPPNHRRARQQFKFSRLRQVI